MKMWVKGEKESICSVPFTFRLLFIDYGQPKLIYLPTVRIVSGQIWEGSRLYSIL